MSITYKAGSRILSKYLDFQMCSLKQWEDQAFMIKKNTESKQTGMFQRCE